MSRKNQQNDDNINRLFQELKSKCFDSVKCQNKLEDTLKSLEKASKAESSELKETFDDNLEVESGLYDRIIDLGERIANFNGNKNEIGDVQLKSSDLLSKNDAVHRKIQQLKRNFDSKVPASSTSKKTGHYEEDDNRNEENNGSLLEEKLIVQNVQTNSVMLKQRRENLEEAKIVAGQIKGMAQELKFEVMVQGENLNQIEGQIIEINDNAIKSEKEIGKADEISKSSRRKTGWIIGIIVFIVAATVTLVLLLTIL